MKKAIFYNESCRKNLRKVAFSGIVLTILIGAIPFAAAQDFIEGLVLYHAYDEGKGARAEDLSGNGHDGEIDNPVWVKGKFETALEFGGDGSGTFVTAKAQTNLMLTNAPSWRGLTLNIGTECAKSLENPSMAAAEVECNTDCLAKVVPSSLELKPKPAEMISQPIYLKPENGYILLLPTMARPA